ncbi:hypothetical protein [Pseudorhodoplanes sp.]|uniref:hypothetical protein n=1 Tax=Pseudorhodoplanes sp. TaxID=1934341 RepID=UPI002D7E7DA2|nr:hypothetical protein [Pseudorhodoplanes sp.]
MLATFAARALEKSGQQNACRKRTSQEGERLLPREIVHRSVDISDIAGAKILRGTVQPIGRFVNKVRHPRIFVGQCVGRLVSGIGETGHLLDADVLLPIREAAQAIAGPPLAIP